MGYKFNPFTGNLDEVSAGGGGGTPGGSDTQVQYNNAGSFGGSADLTWNDTAKELGVGGDINLDDGGTYSTTVQTVTPTANRTISFPDATGTVALVAGSNQAVQYNSAGANAGDSGLLYDATGGSLTVGGKTVTTSAPVINLSQTWNNAATTFTGLKLNVTNTASAAASNLLDLQVGGSSKFNVTTAGQLKTTSGQGDIETGLNPAAGDFRVNVNGLYVVKYGNNYISSNLSTGYRQWLFQPGTGFVLNSSAYFGWSDQNFNIHNSNYDIKLYRDDAGTLAQRNGTNAQTFRLYGTYTDASNYERTSITRDSSGLVIDAQKGGTGADPTNLLDLKLGGVSEFRVDQTGQIFGAGFSVGTAAGLLKLGSSTGSLYAYLSASSTQLNAQTLFINTAANDVTLAANGKDLLLSAGSGKTVKITHVAEVASSSTIAGLPASPVVGMVTRVTDGDSGLTFGNTVVNSGAGATPYLVWYNGTNWTVIGA